MLLSIEHKPGSDQMCRRGEKKGRSIMFEGKPEDMVKKGEGYTAEFLKKKLGGA